MEENWESFFFFRGEFGEDKIDVADFLAKFVVPCAETKARKIFGFEAFDDGFESVIAASGATFAKTESVEGEIEIVADDKDAFFGNLVEVFEG